MWVSAPWGVEKPTVLNNNDSKIKYTIMGNTMHYGDCFGKFLL